MTQSDYVVVFSGGLDSTTLLYDMCAIAARRVTAVSFNYGQRHKKELDYAKKTCEKLKVEHVIIDLWASGLYDALSSSETPSSLLADSPSDVPEGHYAEESMKSTVVPNRNMMMISIAGAIAVARDAKAVTVGVHSGDHFIYPDCTAHFIEEVSKALYQGNRGMSNLDRFHAVQAPYLYKSKAEIAYRALELDVPFEETWSCYKGGENHCGRCGTCVERIEAISWAGTRKNKHLDEIDKTVYDDTTFWESMV